MAESSSSSSSSPTEDIVRFIKRLSAYVAFKMSSFFSTAILNLDTRSLSVIAGLAIAVIFTWRALRTSGEQRQRKRPKRTIQSGETSSAAAHSNLNKIPPEVSSPHVDNAIQDVVDQFFQLVKPTLGQLVRQKLMRVTDSFDHAKSSLSEALGWVKLVELSFNLCLKCICSNMPPSWSNT